MQTPPRLTRLEAATRQREILVGEIGYRERYLHTRALPVELKDELAWEVSRRKKWLEDVETEIGLLEQERDRRAAYHAKRKNP